MKATQLGVLFITQYNIGGDFYKITVEAGRFQDCLEVITETETKDGVAITRDYYAPYIGKVYSEFKTPHNKDFVKLGELMKYQ